MTTTETPAARVIPVLALYAGEARAKLEKLAKRAAKYGQTISWTETKRVERTKRVSPYGEEKVVEVERVDFAIVGEAPRVGDHKFLASLEYAPGGVLVSSIGGVEIGEAGYNWAGECEHCGSNRARKFGFVVEDGEGKRSIVGKSCLRDYLGTDVPAGAISLFQYLREFGSGEDGESWGGSGRWYETTLGVIATTRAAIALWGWRPSSHGGITTSTYVGIVYGPVERDRDGKPYWDDERKALKEELRVRGAEYAAEAERIVEWGANLAPRGDYEHNLKVALAGEFVVGKTFNLVVSACAAFDRQVAREDEVKAKREAEAARFANLPASDWVGQVGSKVSFDVTVDRVIALPDNGFGPSQIYKFVADNGAILTWKTGSFPRVDGEPVRANDRLSIVGSVKGHGEFRDVRETYLVRVKMTKPVAKAA